MALFNKGEIKSGLKTAFWAAVGSVVFVAPLAIAFNYVKSRFGMTA